MPIGPKPPRLSSTPPMDRGSYELRFDGESGPVRDVGKFIVVWKKVAGEWKVAADIFNSDLKAP